MLDPKQSSPDRSLRGVFIKRTPFYHIDSDNKPESEWILVPCAQQAPVTTKPLIIS